MINRIRFPFDSWLHRRLFAIETDTINGRWIHDNIEAEAAGIIRKSEACISRWRTRYSLRDCGRFAIDIRNGWQSVSAACHMRSSFDEIVESPRIIWWNCEIVFHVSDCLTDNNLFLEWNPHNSNHWTTSTAPPNQISLICWRSMCPRKRSVKANKRQESVTPTTKRVQRVYSNSIKPTTNTGS